MKIVVTIDIETPQTPLFKKQIEQNLIDPNEQGMSVIQRIMEDTGIQGVFFVNVYEAWKWGDSFFKRAVTQWEKSGHEIALHTHPVWLDEKETRCHMWEYDLTEQIQIIKQGKNKLENWTQSPIVSHRAGAYGANSDTLESLISCNIKIDSSVFHPHPNCKIPLTRNQPCYYKNILLMPVTYANKSRRKNILGWNYHSSNSYVKTDIDSMTMEQMLLFIKKATHHQIPVLNLFLHSYSLMNWRNNAPVVNIKKATQFKKLLQRLQKDRHTFICFRDLPPEFAQHPEPVDIVPGIFENHSIIKKLCHR